MALAKTTGPTAFWKAARLAGVGFLLAAAAMGAFLGALRTFSQLALAFGEGHRLRVLQLELLDIEGCGPGGRRLCVDQVVHHRVDGVDHQRQEDERESDGEPEDPAPEGEAGADQGRIFGFDHFGVGGHPWRVGQ